jgi:hypothetical protein
MADRIFGEAPTVGKDTGSSVLKGHVIDVNTKRYTASVATEAAGRKYFDLAIGVPYAHPEKGEGYYVLPDIGAQCWIATDGGGGPPIIICFAPMPKISSTTEQNSNPDAEPQEGDEVMADFSSKRPQRLPGEFGLVSRDGAFLHYRKGGIVEIGANPACQRLFIPLGSHIRDVCEDYGALTAGGIHYFQTDRMEGSDGSDANALWRVLVKDKAVDPKGSVLFEMGHTPGDKRLQIAIVPQAIKFQDGSYETASAVYYLVIKPNGDLDEKASSVTRKYSKLEVTVEGTSSELVTGEKKIISGGMMTLGSDAQIILNASMVIMSGSLDVGGNVSCSNLSLGGAFPSLLAFKGAYNSHTHVITLPGPPPVPITSAPPTIPYP